MRWVRWVVCGFVSSMLSFACGKSERTNGGGADSGTGTGGSLAGTNGKGGVSGTGTNGKGGSTGTGGSGGAARTFLDELYGAYCSRLMTCTIATNDAIAERLFLQDEARCLDAFRELVVGDAPMRDLLAKLEAGTIQFVPGNRAACLEEAEDCARQGSIRPRAACRSVFEGSVPIGGECQRWEDCAGDAYCNNFDGCPGHCAVRGGPGAACMNDEDCDEGDGYALCDYSTAEPSCKRIPIRANAALGEPCTLRLSIDTASELVPCVNGLFCREDVSGMGNCAEPIAMGEPCDSPDDLCAGDGICLDATCAPAQIARNEGDPCPDLSNVFCDAYAALTCVNGQCQRVGDGSEGSPCPEGDVVSRASCGNDQYCNGIDTIEPICAALLEAGAPCESGGQCLSGTCATMCAASYCDG